MKMKDSDFQGIVKSLMETRAFLKGQATPGRVPIPKEIDVVAIREKAKLSQARFAENIGVSVATLRNWEQGRRVPDGSARVLLAMLAKNPHVVEEVLA
jgi:putative transcriptional regulator